MTSVFISYSRSEKAIADYVAAELRNRGAEVFVDYQTLVPGENFVARIGHEIEARDVMVLLLSPRSVESEWVKAEVVWAFNKKKRIIPILLEPASLTEFFFLINLEQVDFTRWSVDGNVEDAIRKLATALGLSTTPVRAEPMPDLVIKSSATVDDGSATEERTIAPTFARGDLSELFFTATEVEPDDPEQAVFLYRQILTIDPHYLHGKAQNFVQRAEIRLKPQRLKQLQTQAEAAMRAGQWKQAEHIGNDMLSLDEKHADAKRIVAVSVKNTECEPVYERAVIAAQAGRWNAVVTLLQDVKATCPDYGDPQSILARRPISLNLIEFLSNSATLQGHSNSVLTVAFSPDGKLLASGSDDNTIRLWEVAGQRMIATLQGYTSAVMSVAFSPDGQILTSGSADNTIKLWEVAGRRVIATLQGHADAVQSVAFSPDGKLLASGSGDNTIIVWSRPRKQGGPRVLATLRDHAAKVQSVAFSPDGKLLASGAGDNTIKLWEVLREKAYVHSLATLQGHTSAVQSVAFSPDGQLLASGSADNTIKLWEVAGQRMIATLQGHTAPVFSVAFSPDGQLLASGSADNTIKLWEVAGQRVIVTLQGHADAVQSVAFSLDGKLLASGASDKSIKLWGLSW